MENFVQKAAKRKSTQNNLFYNLRGESTFYLEVIAENILITQIQGHASPMNWVEIGHMF